MIKSVEIGEDEKIAVDKMRDRGGGRSACTEGATKAYKKLKGTR
jgi:hypothetical protein